MFHFKGIFRRMILAEFLSAAFIVTVFVGILMHNTIRSEEEAAEELLTTYGTKSGEQLETLIAKLETISYSIAASDDIKNILKKADRAEGNADYFDSAVSERRDVLARAQLFSGSNIKNRTVNIVSARGDFLSLGIYTNKSYTREQILSLGRLEMLTEGGLYKFMTAPGDDIYGKTDKQLFSLVRRISDQLGLYGYVEIQDSTESLDDILENTISTLDTSSLIIYHGSYFYGTGKDQAFWEEELSRLTALGKEGESVAFSAGGKDYYLYTDYLKNYDIGLFTLGDTAPMKAALNRTLLLILFMGLAILAAAVFLMIFATWRIYEPVRTLRKEMENRSFEELKLSLSDDRTSDEIDLFKKAFSSLLDNIHSQNEELLNRKMRELQISYQALQTQVSPHFLHNTLSVIGLKGMMADCPEIMDMCSTLTKMMAYSMDQKTTSVLFSQELEYMESYLSLMKYRYMDKLSVEIDADDAVRRIPVAKFILQPIVENCFTHAFRNVNRSVFRIRIRIRAISEGWQFSAEDNGCGFSPEELSRVYEEMEKVKQSIRGTDINAGFVKEITGIGLINTYARLLLTEEGSVDLTILPGQDNGSRIELTVKKNVS